MNRKEFGKLIAALREEHLEFSTRGMGVWTQAKLAKEANLAEKTIAQLEQGKKMNLDPQTLMQLARALKLTAGEQLELYTAAAEVDSEPHKAIRDRAEDTLRTLLRLLGDVRVPAYLHDPYANVIAGNTAVTEPAAVGGCLFAGERLQPDALYLFASVALSCHVGRCLAGTGDQRCPLLPHDNTQSAPHAPLQGDSGRVVRLSLISRYLV